MELSKFNPPLTSEELLLAQDYLGFAIPDYLLKAYGTANGGNPTKGEIQGPIFTIVSKFLPIISKNDDSSVALHKDFIKDKHLASLNYFPFAHDWGGEFFFVDLSSVHGTVHYLVTDSVAPKMINCGFGFEEFWDSLVEWKL